MFSEEDSTDVEQSALPFPLFLVSDGDPVPESSSPDLNGSSSPLIGSWDKAYEEDEGGSSAKENKFPKGVYSAQVEKKLPESTSPALSSACYESASNCDGDESEGETEVSSYSTDSRSSLGALSQDPTDRFASNLQAKLLVLKRRQEMYPTTALFARRYPTITSSAGTPTLMCGKTGSTVSAPVIPESPRPKWRVIKRTYSGAYMRDDGLSSAASSDFRDREHEETGIGPDAKRRKTVDYLRGGHSSGTQLEYAHRAASLRRAESLKSTISPKGKASKDLVPTQPCTPTQKKKEQSDSSRELKRKSDRAVLPLMSPVPIIAPPLDHVTVLPISPEAISKIRFEILVQRETDVRNAEGLNGRVGTVTGASPSYATSLKAKWERVLGIGIKKRVKVINWMLDVQPPKPVIELWPALPTRDSEGSNVSSSTCSSASRSTRTSSSDSSSSEGTRSVSRTPKIFYTPGYNLHDQLTAIPETRFHAAWLLLRHFHLMSYVSANDARTDKSEGDHLSEAAGFDLVLWDCAVACLALSVKFHRDFLEPLIPVLSREYLRLAPHEISYENLETAQRDILSAINYRFGVSPQAIMDGFWSSLPSLQVALAFEGGWADVMEDAWTSLYDAVCGKAEPDALRFSIVLLTTVAIMDGVTETLARRYALETIVARDSGLAEYHPLKGRMKGRLQLPRVREGEIHSLLPEMKGLAREVAVGLFKEIQELVGASGERLWECQLWVDQIHNIQVLSE